MTSELQTYAKNKQTNKCIGRKDHDLEEKLKSVQHRKLGAKPTIFLSFHGLCGSQVFF